MISQWGNWLRQLAADGKGGATLPSIDRGLPYTLRMAVPLDVSGDSFLAALRLGPDADDPVLATFTVAVGDFADDYTVVEFALDDTTTDALPGDDDFDGLAELVFDILRKRQEESRYHRFVAGNVFVSGKVTING